MPFVTLPAHIADIEAVYDVQFAAFVNEPIIDFLFPGGVDRPAHTKGSIAYWNHDTISYTTKCVDTETGNIVGMATWEIYWKPGHEGTFKKPDGIPWLEGEDKARCEAIFNPMWDMRAELFGDSKYIYLASIAVHPDYQRRGIGGTLLDWGIDQADKLQVPIYTEASKDGFGLFIAYGFEKLDHVSLIHKAEVLGREDDEEVPLVVRMPSVAKISFKEWVSKGRPKLEST
ncbi:hypothetical protein NQ176_g343 [Zarea fungicola]|uniref:Uncharacterized protein n=1 Tax=Zarea fungicola TaxID=93591 RepID=A0ACC1P039_9HYPO|nr:hypothetical protein NQ176_g343 [Lecanicillium fungicola]